MNRRIFLQQAVLAAGLLPIAADELLWRPTKKIFLPPPGGWATGLDLANLNSKTIEYQILQGIGMSFRKQQEDYIVWKNSGFLHGNVMELYRWPRP